MKLISWNVNGLRALVRKEADQWLWNSGADVIVLQETKASPDQLPDEVLQKNGYHSYFSSSVLRKGYSGVAFYVKQKPAEVKVGLDIEKFDEQGRVITVIYETFVIMGAYFPNGNSQTASLDYKLDFYKEFLLTAERYREQGKSVILGGDFNVAHTAIDLARPEANKKNIGFLPEERAWIDEYIDSGYIDVFRSLNPQKTDVYTYWDMKSRARERNVGWRIDYWFVSEDLLPQIVSFKTHSDVYGSDHCPIELDIVL